LYKHITPINTKKTKYLLPLHPLIFLRHHYM